MVGPTRAEAAGWEIPEVEEEPRTPREKYGKAEPQLKQLYNDVLEWLEAGKPVAAQALAGSRTRTTGETAART